MKNKNISEAKIRKMPLHVQIAIGKKPKGPIAAKNAVSNKK